MTRGLNGDSLALAAALASVLLAGCSSARVPHEISSACLRVQAGGAATPLNGYPVSLLEREWRRRGGGVHMDGRNVMVLTSHDALTHRNIVFKLEVQPGPSGYRTDQCGPASVVVTRMLIEDQVLTDMTLQDALFAIVDSAAKALSVSRPQEVAVEVAPERTPPAPSTAVPPAPNPAAAAPSLPAVPALASSPPTSITDDSPAPPANLFGLTANTRAEHPCRATYQGRPLFAGRCTVNTGGGETAVFSPTDGCTFTLRPGRGGVTGDLSAYRDSCWLDRAAERELEETAGLGVMHRSGSCWTGNGAEVCVTR